MYADGVLLNCGLWPSLHLFVLQCDHRAGVFLIGAKLKFNLQRHSAPIEQWLLIELRVTFRFIVAT